MEVEKYFDEWSEHYGIPNELPLFLRWNFNHILDKLPSKDSSQILDLGCGNGILLCYIAKHMPNAVFTGVDFSSGMIAVGEKNMQMNNLEVQLIKASLTHIPLDNNSMDYVVSNNALHHVEDKDALYREVIRILKPEGSLIYADSHDAVDTEFDAAKREFLANDKDFAVEYKRSADDTWQAVPQYFKENHPREYHYPFKDVRIFLERAGFADITISPSPSYFAIVSAKKP